MKYYLRKNIPAKFFLFGIFIFVFSWDIYAFNLVGTWKLVSIEQQERNRKWQTDCYAPTGLLIYTSSGYMSAGINCMENAKHNTPSFNPKNLTFYMGKYLIKNNTITHSVQNSSNAKYYGKHLVREFKIVNANEIILIVKNTKDKLVRLKWSRIEPINN